MTEDTTGGRDSRHIVMRWVRSIAPFVLIALGMFWWSSRLTNSELKNGIAAPSLNAQVLHPNENTHQSFDMKTHDKVVVLNFWASWCPPCIKEIPAINAVAKTESDVLILGVTVDLNDPAELSKWRDKFGIEYAIATGSPELVHSYGVSMLPTTVIIDEHGMVSKTLAGEVTEAKLRKAIAVARQAEKPVVKEQVVNQQVARSEEQATRVRAH